MSKFEFCNNKRKINKILKEYEDNYLRDMYL